MQVDRIAAEDTRHSARLLAQFGIETPMFSYHDHGSEQQASRIFNILEKGDSVALITDAGTPLVSDPGYRLVKEARARGIAVIPIPGACALIAALSASGLPSDRFVFEGFPPAKRAARRAYYESIQHETRTLVFYESTHRVRDSLEDMREALGGDRACVVARELTKTYETFLGDTLDEVFTAVDRDVNQLRGEFVLLVAGYKMPAETGDLPSVESRRVFLILREDLPLKQAVALAARITGDKKNPLYQWALSKDRI